VDDYSAAWCRRGVGGGVGAASARRRRGVGSRAGEYGASRTGSTNQHRSRYGGRPEAGRPPAFLVELLAMTSTIPGSRTQTRRATRTRRVAAGAALAPLTAGLISGCTSSAPPTTPAAATCAQPHQATLPDGAGLITNADSGSFCVQTGQKIDILLAVATSDGTAQGRWAEVSDSNPDVLQSQDASALITPVGVTSGIFKATKAGIAQLTSTRSDGKAWTVTIVVRPAS